jgi:mono/diheme cytochrome c family protein
MRTWVVIGVLAMSGLAMVACSGTDLGPKPSDTVLAEGQQVYKEHCAACHGAKGQGGNGSKLAGKVAENYPNIADQIALINNGRSSMPAWKNSLTAEQINAVARYERECLGTTC